MDAATTNWLLEGDPSIRWQVQRDLLDAPDEVWRAKQELVANEGWGERLLAVRGADGRWSKGLYTPKWTSTTYTLLQLWRMGLPRDNPEAVASTQLLMDKPVWIFGKGDKAHRGECVAGFGLSLSSWFTIDGEPRERLVEEILERQLDDGGWNCRTRTHRHTAHFTPPSMSWRVCGSIASPAEPNTSMSKSAKHAPGNSSVNTTSTAPPLVGEPVVI